MSNNSFDLNVLVNGNRCKQHHHQGKIFVEAKNGSEYVIEIKNNYWKRVLAVGSVDGLNVLTGKKASDRDSGYIVNGYSSEKIKGFRFSDDEWAMFRFGYKFYGNTYAQSKEDGSEKNCGIIGMRVFYENEPVYTCSPPVAWNTTPSWLTPTPYIPTPQPYYPPWNTYSVSASWSGFGTGACSAGGGTYTSNVNYCANNIGTQDLNLYDSSTSKGGGYISPGVSTRQIDNSLLKEAIADAKAVRATALANAKSADKMVSKFKKLSGTKCSARGGQSATLGFCDTSYVEYEREIEKPKAEFDMGTEWGRREHSTVRNVNFERGCLAQSFDIYYASREALIAMGVPINNELLLPQSFPNQYAEPPKNWIG